MAGSREPEKESKSMTLNERELATVLAALRHYERYIVACGARPADVDEIATDGDTLTALNVDEIDALCERINTEE